MFLLERPLRKRREKINNWNKQADAWAAEMNEKYGGEYDRDTYERRSGTRPYRPIGEVFTVVFVPAGIIAVVSLVIVYILTRPPKPVDPDNPNDCKTVVKKGDDVGIIAGDFNGSKGTVIQQEDGGCAITLTLTESTYTMKRCKEIDYGYCTDVREDGEILKIDNSSDVVKL
tara:strand:- start:438 stop:953 length:516 start_codon:yes stop_codon:yes gene_type:complete